MLLFLPFFTPATGSFPILKWDDVSGANADYQDDSLDYESISGGMLVITKFDTVNNVVSGTFTFTAALKTDPSKTETIAAGYFNDIPITVGSFGQGKITANINGFNFTTVARNFNAVSAYTTAISPQLNFVATGSDTTKIRQIFITLVSPQTGNFVAGDQVSQTTAVISYGTSYGNPDESISSTAGATGIISITKADPVMHRIWGTFQLSGKDPTNGKMITITNGVIDNIQWFDE